VKQLCGAPFVVADDDLAQIRTLVADAARYQAKLRAARMRLDAAQAEVNTLIGPAVIAQNRLNKFLLDMVKGQIATPTE
jgi:hypothetical protein